MLYNKKPDIRQENNMYMNFKELNQWQTLHAEGNRLYNERHEKVRLIGVNVAPLVWSCYFDKMLELVNIACDDWKSNVIRLPMNQDMWFGFGRGQKGVDESGERYRSLIDDLVGTIASRNKYIILDLHRSNCNTWGEFISGGHADMNSLVFWKDVACRYKNHPNVIFDLYNEPFQISWDVWKNGGEITVMYEESDIRNQIMYYKTDSENLKTITYQVPGMQKMVEVIRGVGAKNIVMIGGLDWSYELDGIMKGYEIDDCGGNGILLDAHLYPCKDLDRWDELVTVAASKYPIIIGECGHYGEAPVKHEWPQLEESTTWVPKFLKWVDEYEYNITAWDFHHRAGPCLIENLEDYTPTPYWGAYYKEYMAKHNK